MVEFFLCLSSPGVSPSGEVFPTASLSVPTTVREDKEAGVCVFASCISRSPYREPGFCRLTWSLRCIAHLATEPMEMYFHLLCLYALSSGNLSSVV